MVNISVMIPVGPHLHNVEHLTDAIYSAAEQTTPPDEIILLDDMACLDVPKIVPYALEFTPPAYDRYGLQRWNAYNGKPAITLWQAPTLLSVSDMYNIGITVAKNNLIMMLNSDDKLLPACLENCFMTWKMGGEKDAFYFVTYQLSTGDVQGAPIVGMWTRGFFKRVGGYPLTCVGAPDYIFSGIMGVKLPHCLIPVPGVLYWHRVNLEKQNYTQQQSTAFFPDVINAIRDIEINRFEENPTWTQRLQSL